MQRRAVKAQGETLDWLKARLAVLEEISPESEVHTQRAALDKLSQQFSALLLSLSEVKSGPLLGLVQGVLFQMSGAMFSLERKCLHKILHVHIYISSAGTFYLWCYSLTFCMFKLFYCFLRIFLLQWPMKGKKRLEMKRRRRRR